MINLKTKHEIDLMARAGQLLASVLPPLAAVNGHSGSAPWSGEVARKAGGAGPAGGAGKKSP